MIKVDVRLSKELESIEIHPLSDLHIGDRHSDINAIRDKINAIKEKENAYIILNGDLIDNATKTSISDIYSQVLTPLEQINQVVELLKPVSDRILAMTGGNHEARTYRKEGIDISRLVARELGIEDKYSEGGVVLFVSLGKTSKRNHEKPFVYSIYALHGSGGGRKEGSKAIRLADMASIIDVDIYIHSHVHMPICMRKGFLRTTFNSNSVYQVDKLFVNTAANLSYGGYGEAMEFSPSSTTNPIITLSGTHKFANATL